MRKDARTVRFALIQSIETSESLIDAYGKTPDPVFEPHLAFHRRHIADCRALLIKRYGGLPPDPLAGTKAVSFQDIMNTEPHDFVPPAKAETFSQSATRKNDGDDH